MVVSLDDGIVVAGDEEGYYNNKDNSMWDELDHKNKK
jgi:hypothetical protein